MNQDKTKALVYDFGKSLIRLREASKEALSKGSIVIDGTIQRFEFTFELSWKLMRLVLQNEGIDTNSPHAAIKEAFRNKLIQDGDAWIDMLEDRNMTSHLYDEKNLK